MVAYEGQTARNTCPSTSARSPVTAVRAWGTDTLSSKKGN